MKSSPAWAAWSRPRGRIIYVLDEGQLGVYEMPSRNGRWKPATPSTGSCSGKSRCPIGPPDRAGRTYPAVLNHAGWQLMAIAVLLPTGVDAARSTAVDAVTGETLKRLTSAAKTDGDLLLRSRGRGGRSGARMWPRPSSPFGREPSTTRGQSRHRGWRPIRRPLIPARSSSALARLTALDLNTGKEVWRLPSGNTGSKRELQLPAGMIVVHDGKIYCGGGSGLMAVSAADGKVLWAQQEKAKVPQEGVELFVTDGLIWRFH